MTPYNVAHVHITQNITNVINPAKPQVYKEVGAPSGTTSAVLVDVPGASVDITLTEPAYLAIIASVQLRTQSGAALSIIEFAANISGVDHDPYQRFLSGSNDVGVGALVHRSDVQFPIGTYTVKMRYRRASGVATPGIDRLDMLVLAL